MTEKPFFRTWDVPIEATVLSPEQVLGLGKLGEAVASCPTRLMDGRNELRCWYPAGHEGDCR